MGNGGDAGKKAGISDVAVRERTGRGWKEWFDLLDRVGATKMAHKDIAELLHREHGVPRWWCQMVTVAYEQERGLRMRHQRATGFEVSRTRTVAASLDAAYAAFEDGRRRQRWLREKGLTCRKKNPGKNLRLTWSDGESILDVRFSAKGPGKTQVVVQHGKLSSAAEAETMKQYWGEALGRLKDLLES